MKKISDPKTIILSRTDAIGDVILSLPLAGILKSKFPECQIYFFGRSYTKPVISLSKYIDGFIDFDEFKQTPDKPGFLSVFGADTMVHIFPRKEIATAAGKAGIVNRIGTSHRIYHLFTCNYRLNIGRKNSDLHEAQLNLKLLQPFGINAGLTTNEISDFFGLENVKPLPEKFLFLIDQQKLNIILHPKSNLSAREWGLNNFSNLISLLPPQKFKIFITGSINERNLLTEWLKNLPEHVVDLTGLMTLDELISFIYHCDGLVAASTGPLHIAAALNRYALGIYPPIRPMHPGRWAPLGKHASYMVNEIPCNDCKGNPLHCTCMQGIDPAKVAARIMMWQKL